MQLVSDTSLLDEMMDFGEFTCSILFSVKKIEIGGMINFYHSFVLVKRSSLNIIFSIWPIQQQIVEGDLLSGCIEANFLEQRINYFFTHMIVEGKTFNRDCHLCNLFMIFGT
ncbi:hypothetical protein ACJX0J_040263, partial [Zea mays]